IMAAFLVPQIIILFAFASRERAFMEPIASVASALLVVALCWAAPTYSFAGLRSAATRFYGEMLMVCAVTTGLAILWTRFLLSQLDFLDDPSLVSDELGLGWAILLVGVFPAIFEELAFRGLVQGRLTAILGHKEGILATGAAFALAHGISLGLPFHFFIGWYLCSLRDRSGSLFPGMLLHFLYNSTLVLVFG
ncbi:MAG: CPBP family intramembrane metalloprotease, partial [Planctomycetes bacterium]|nr:CPBP family intramembrane metalloprotease [Planctomycetota bacterium]